MSEVKIGIQLYSVRKALAEDMPKTIKKLADIGYEAVEFFGGSKYSVEEILAVLKENNLEVCGYHTPWDYVQDGMLNAWIAYNKAIGNDKIIVPGLPKECTETIEAWQATAEKFNCIAKKLAKQNMKLGYHNHHAEFMPIGGEIPWDAFMEKTCPSIIAQYDIGNSLMGTGIDALAYHKKYIGRGTTIHAKAYSSEGKHAAIGEDDINWERYVEIIKEAGVTEYCIVEYEHEDDDLFDKIATSYNTLKKLF